MILINTQSPESGTKWSYSSEGCSGCVKMLGLIWESTFSEDPNKIATMHEKNILRQEEIWEEFCCNLREKL